MGIPRTVKGASKLGWFCVEISHVQRQSKNVSHLGLCIWADRNCKKRYVSEFSHAYPALLNYSRFAFENALDANWFSWRWA